MLPAMLARIEHLVGQLLAATWRLRVEGSSICFCFASHAIAIHEIQNN